MSQASPKSAGASRYCLECLTTAEEGALACGRCGSRSLGPVERRIGFPMTAGLPALRAAGQVAPPANLQDRSAHR